MFPNPIKIILEFFRLFSDSEILSDITRTLWRVIGAIMIGSLIGVPFKEKLSFC